MPEAYLNRPGALACFREGRNEPGDRFGRTAEGNPHVAARVEMAPGHCRDSVVVQEPMRVAVAIGSLPGNVEENERATCGTNRAEALDRAESFQQLVPAPLEIGEYFQQPVLRPLDRGKRGLLVDVGTVRIV